MSTNLFLRKNVDIIDSWKENINEACGGDMFVKDNLKKILTPNQQTYGKIVYANAFIGTIIGCVLE